MPQFMVSEDYETPAWMNEFVFQYKTQLRTTKPAPTIIIATKDNPDVPLHPDQCLEFFKRLCSMPKLEESKDEQIEDQASNSGEDEDRNTPQPFPRKNKQGLQQIPSDPQDSLQIMTGNGIVMPPTPFETEENWEGFTCERTPPRDETMRKRIADQERLWRHQTERDRFDSEGILQDVCSRKVFEMEKSALENAEKLHEVVYVGPVLMAIKMIQECVKKSMKMKIDQREFEKHSLKTELDYEKIIIAKEFSETRKKLEEGINYIGKIIFRLRNRLWEMEEVARKIDQILEDLTNPLIIKTEVDLFKLENTMDPKAPFPVDLQIGIHHLATVLEGLSKIIEFCPFGKYTHPPLLHPRKVVYFTEPSYGRGEELYGRREADVDGGLMSRVPEENQQTPVETMLMKTKSPLKVKKYLTHQRQMEEELEDIKKSNVIKDLKDWDRTEFRMNVTALNSFGFGILESAVLLNKFDNKPDKVIKYLQQVMM